MENKHINKEQLALYHCNQLSGEDMSAFLEHISQCTYCAGLFAQSMEETMIIPAPKNLKERILIEADKIKPAAAKRQFFFYSLRLCAGMCSAIAFLFLVLGTAPSISLPKAEPAAQPLPETSYFFESVNSSLYEFTYQINETMNDFVSNQSTHFEVKFEK